MDRRKIDVALGALFTLIAFLIVTENFVEGGMETDIGSMFLPRLVAVLILLFSNITALHSLYKLWTKVPQQKEEIVGIAGFTGIGMYLLIFAFYWFATPLFGFLVTTPVVLFAVMLLLGARNWPVMFLIALVAPQGVYYGCYHYLRVLLPVWSL